MVHLLVLATLIVIGSTAQCNVTDEDDIPVGHGCGNDADGVSFLQYSKKSQITTRSTAPHHKASAVEGKLAEEADPGQELADATAYFAAEEAAAFQEEATAKMVELAPAVAPAEEKPAEEAALEKPAEEKPAEQAAPEEPAEEAAPEKPAEEKPAEEAAPAGEVQPSGDVQPSEMWLSDKESTAAEEKSVEEAAAGGGGGGDISGDGGDGAEVQPSELLLSDIPKFVISTAKDGRRTLPFVHEIQKYGTAFKNTCRVQAVVGAQCIDFWHGALELGASSVSNSHLKIWQHMVTEQIPVAMIIEDDAIGLTARNWIPLLQKALDRHKSYDLFRVSQIPVPGARYMKNDLNPRIVEHQEGKCRQFFGTQLYIMTLAGAKLSLESILLGATRHSLDVYLNSNNQTVYKNIDSFRIECFGNGIMRFMNDAEGDFSKGYEIHDKSKVDSERIHPGIIQNTTQLSSEDKRLIEEVLPDCPTGGILMEPCASYVCPLIHPCAWKPFVHNDTTS